MEVLSEQMGAEAARRKPIRLPRVPFTMFVSAASIALSLAWWAGASMSLLDLRGIYDGEYWRFIICTLVHGDIGHLASSVIIVWLLGVPIECRYGLWRMAVLYGVLAVGSSAATCLAAPPGIGMSGVLYAYWGLLLAAGNTANGPKVRFPRFITVVMLLSGG